MVRARPCAHLCLFAFPLAWPALQVVSELRSLVGIQFEARLHPEESRHVLEFTPVGEMSNGHACPSAEITLVRMTEEGDVVLLLFDLHLKSVAGWIWMPVRELPRSIRIEIEFGSTRRASPALEPVPDALPGAAGAAERFGS